MLGEGDGQHEGKSAKMGERGEYEGIGPARAVSPREVSRPPYKDRSDGVGCGRELWHCRHVGRGYQNLQGARFPRVRISTTLS